MRIERHVFGSTRGYTTLAASAGLNAEERRQIEAVNFTFGQTGDAAFLASLATSPAYFTRPLRGGAARALTRVLDGGRDEKGRPTLRMVTAVLTQAAWDGELCGDVSRLLGMPRLWDWDGAAELAAMDAPAARPHNALHRAAVPKLLALFTQLERAARDRQPVVTPAEDLAPAEMAAVEMLLPAAARRQYGTAYRALSAALGGGVLLNALAPEAAHQRLNFRCAAGPMSAPSAYARFLAERTSLPAGALPLAEALSYPSFGANAAAAPVEMVAAAAAAAAAAARPPRPVDRAGAAASAAVVYRTPGWVGATAAVAALSRGAAGFFAGRASAPPADRSAVALLPRPRVAAASATEPSDPTRDGHAEHPPTSRPATAPATGDLLGLVAVPDGATQGFDLSANHLREVAAQVAAAARRTAAQRREQKKPAHSDGAAPAAPAAKPASRPAHAPAAGAVKR